jgi:hypothetical protein
MAGKRYKPALYELVGKGRVKPDDKGALGTPKWFYGEGEQEVKTEPVRQEPKVIIHQGPRIPQPTMQQEVKEPETAESRQAQPEKEFGLHLGKEIRIRAPWWAMVLAVLGLVLSFLVTYWIGQATVDQAGPTTSRAGMDGGVSPGDSGPSEELNNIRNGPVQKGVLNPPKPTTPPDPGKQEQKPPARIEATGSLCLILCGSDKRRDLIDVQEYFTKKGILTRIGRLGDRYVLYTARGVDSLNETLAKQLKDQAAKLGEGYNQEKNRTAASFPGSTFKTAYWVKKDAIMRID